MRKDILTALVVFVLCLNIFFLSYVLFVTQPRHDTHLTAYASTGQIGFCINNAPGISVPCNTTLSQNQSFTCQLNLSDVDGGNLTVREVFVTNRTVFSVNLSGWISVTPSNDDVGNHSVIFIVNDTLECVNSFANTTYSFTVDNINDAPVLVQNIPDQELNVNTSLSAFYLTDYFSDPDGDTMNFSSTSPVGITVTILPTSEVFFSSETCDDIGQLIIFTATDPFDASTDSNAVTVRVTCDDGDQGGGGDTTGGGASGGSGGSANFCTSEWECEDWKMCLPNDLQRRRCYDVNGCEDEKYLQRQCKYEGPPPDCKENWLCSDWSACRLNGTQVRTCDDLSQCRSELFLPPLEQGCVYIASCNDGIKNGNETGVDCGGQCSACALVEQPLPFLQKAQLAAWLMLLLILAILIVSGVLHYYRAQVAQSIAALGFLLRGKLQKQILLTKEQRLYFFEHLAALELRLNKDIYDTLSSLTRQYFEEALGLSSETVKEELEEKIAHHPMREMFLSLFEKLEFIEQHELEHDAYFALATIEELRTMVCLTSSYGLSEIARPMEEFAISEDTTFFDELFIREINVLRAVQFNQLDVSKKEYMKMLEVYESLAEHEKEQFYPELHFLYRIVKFGSEIVES